MLARLLLTAGVLLSTATITGAQSVIYRGTPHTVTSIPPGPPADPSAELPEPTGPDEETLPPTPSSISLPGGTLSATAGQPWRHDFSANATISNLGKNETIWQLERQPAWMSLIASTEWAEASVPVKGSYEFDVLASGKGASDRATYTIVVAGVPVRVSSLSIGNTHSCAVLGDGEIKCWGSGGHGQLGNGLNGTSQTPVSVVDLTGKATSVAVGEFHSCATITGGTVQCWGMGTQGQLGNNLATSSNRPVTVQGLAGAATKVTSGTYHSCSLASNGSASCWGRNSEGQLRANRTTPRFDTARTVSASDVTSIAAGALHTCVSLTDRTARCWGANASRQLGDNSVTADYSTDGIAVRNVSNAKSVVAGENFSCAHLTDDTVSCWGHPQSVGRPSGGTSGVNPGAIQGVGANVAAIGISYRNGCVLLKDGAVSCWGQALGTNPSTRAGLGTDNAVLAIGPGEACSASGNGPLNCYSLIDYQTRVRNLD